MQQQRMTRSRYQLLTKGFVWLILQYVAIDVFDSLNKARAWDTRQMYPVTSLSLPEQLIYTFSLSMETYFILTLQFSVVSCVCVLLGATVEAWPPLFDTPLSATSLADMWTNRWHAIFRRTFNRLSQPILWVIPRSAPAAVRRVTRGCIIFLLSAGLHILLMNRLETNRDFPHPHLLDRSILAFFLSQPISLAIESFLIMPLGRILLPENKQVALTRFWALASLLWTGRHWTDVWVRRGMWGPAERVVIFSPVRGIKDGVWLVTDSPT